MMGEIEQHVSKTNDGKYTLMKLTLNLTLSC
jgi:hypothetical protein